MTSILFVCTGNICRSPTAEGLLRAKATAAGVHVIADSAGTHGYHIGAHPDPRSRTAAAERGVQIGHLRARQVCADDFFAFDWILGLDRGHITHLTEMRPEGATARLALTMDFAKGAVRGLDVPDPYYGGPQDFEAVLDMLEFAVDGLVSHLAAGSQKTPTRRTER